MTNIGLFYGSTTGNTEEVAAMIAAAIGEDKVDVIDISTASIEKLLEYDRLILGSSTWGSGDLQDDWEDFVDSLKEADLKGKKIALFGVGDSVSYGDTFVGGLGELFQLIENSGAEFFGKVSTEGYDYEESPAEIDGKFVGLALDQDNEDDKTEERIQNWVKSLKEEGFLS